MKFFPLLVFDRMFSAWALSHTFSPFAWMISSASTDITSIRKPSMISPAEAHIPMLWAYITCPYHVPSQKAVLREAIGYKGKEHRLRSRVFWLQIPSLPLPRMEPWTSCLISLSPSFFICKMGRITMTSWGFFQGWNEKHLAMCWACRWCSIFGSLIVKNHIFFTCFVLPNSKYQEGNSMIWSSLHSQCSYHAWQGVGII